ncbi:MAG: ROK family protein [Armatimonadetes bacterium]|nr:ROK family protein [Armatimonadota bacterium]
MCLTLGTGIGGGIIINNQLIYGEANGAGEIGHITVNPDGARCNCGNIGCMETEAAGPAIIKRAKAYLKKYKKGLLRMRKKITPLDVYQAALKRDPLALEVWKETGKYLGIGLANCITILNPEKIIFGGRISQAFPFFIKSLKKEINFRARMIPKNFTKLLQAQLGENAGIIGSACLVFEKLNLLN